MANMKSVTRVSNVLNLYTLNDTELSVSEVAQKLAMNKSSVTRLMSTLEATNILQRCARNRKYHLGGKIMELARIYLSNLDLSTIVLPYIRELQEKINQTIFIHIRKGDERVCIEGIESSRPVRRVFVKGERGPLHAGSPGRLLLAYLSDEEIDELIERKGLPRYTDSTITSKKELKENIEKVRKEGIAVSYGEQTSDCFGVSAPIRNYTGRVIAALTVMMLVTHVTPEIQDEYSVLAKETAAKVSLELGYYSAFTV